MVGPELKEIKLSQTTLAQALALLTKKIMAVSHRIPDLQVSRDAMRQQWYEKNII